ncbi:MAG: V-type ATP synthase subunit E [Sphaerochaetaceae bacterium]|nr:V-type ATP synthase subunit E [Sphaerochaetaceae bacterium]MDC7237909.1 V-type ATP synthase subunit E [Sphaerochaetaceae bacterium]
MAQQIQDLVQSIQKEGIEKANKKAEQIITDAKLKADDIVKSAKKEAEKVLSDADKEIALRDQSAKASLSQAARDVQLSLKKALTAEINALLEEKVAKAFKTKDFVKLIKEVISLGFCDVQNTEVQISEKDFEDLAAVLTKELGDKIKQGLEIKPVKTVNVGFKLADKDGSGYFDFSTEATAKLMIPFLSPAIAKIVFN